MFKKFIIRFVGTVLVTALVLFIGVSINAEFKYELLKLFASGEYSFGEYIVTRVRSTHDYKVNSSEMIVMMPNYVGILPNGPYGGTALYKAEGKDFGRGAMSDVLTSFSYQNEAVELSFSYFAKGTNATFVYNKSADSPHSPPVSMAADGESIWFNVNKKGRFNVYLIYNYVTKKISDPIKDLVPEMNVAGIFRISPDKNKVVVSDKERGDIWLLDLVAKTRVSLSTSLMVNNIAICDFVSNNKIIIGTKSGSSYSIMSYEIKENNKSDILTADNIIVKTDGINTEPYPLSATVYLGNGVFVVKNGDLYTLVDYDGVKHDLPKFDIEGLIPMFMVNESGDSLLIKYYNADTKWYSSKIAVFRLFNNSLSFLDLTNPYIDRVYDILWLSQSSVVSLVSTTDKDIAAGKKHRLYRYEIK